MQQGTSALLRRQTVLNFVRVRSVFSGSTWIPRAQSVRFVVGFFWVFSIVVMATYSGNLIAYLTVNRIQLPFDSLERMIESRDYKFGVMGGVLVERLLQVRSI